jgi:hypothetical protein
MPRQREPLPLVGASGKNLPGQSGRVINLYPEQMDGDAKAQYVLKHVPGSFRWADVDAAAFIDSAPDNIRGMHVMGSRAFCAAGNYLLEINANNTFTLLGRLPTTNGIVGFSDNNGTLVVGDGRFFTIDPDVGILTPVLNDGSEPLLGYFSRYIDGTTLYFIRSTEKYYYSEVRDPTTVLGLSFFSAEGNPDPILNAWVVNSEIVLLGDKSTEWHYNNGDADNPFQRISGGFVEHGCIGQRASCRFDNSVVMVGRNEEGQGIVWRLGAAGSAPQRLSTPAVEKHIQKVLFSADNLAEQVTMFGYQDAGHSFFFVNLPAVSGTVNNPAQPSMTWVYDAATGVWHERARRDPATGRFERVLGDYHIAWRGRHYVGDHQNPHVYEFSSDYYRENTIPLVKWVETHGPLNVQGRRFTVTGMELQMEVGAGRDGDAIAGTDPKVVCQVSWDGGYTWSDEMVRGVGKIGAFNTSVRWGPVGSGKNFTARFFISDPIRVTLTGAYADLSVGA